MKQVILKTVVEIDGVQHDISTCDYSESINEAMKDNMLAVDCEEQEIVDWVIESENN